MCAAAAAAAGSGTLLLFEVVKSTSSCEQHTRAHTHTHTPIHNRFLLAAYYRWHFIENLGKKLEMALGWREATTQDPRSDI